jgi:hypothetical protein
VVVQRFLGVAPKWFDDGLVVVRRWLGSGPWWLDSGPGCLRIRN